MENHIIWLCKSMGNSSIFGLFSAVLPQCGICMHLLQVKGWLIIGFPSSRMRVEHESAQVLMRSEHGAAEVYRDELRICMNMGVEHESARVCVRSTAVETYACAARSRTSVRTERSCGKPLKSMEYDVCVEIQKTQPFPCENAISPILQHFLTARLVRKKNEKITVTRVLQEYACGARRLKRMSEQDCRQSMRLEQWQRCLSVMCRGV